MIAGGAGKKDLLMFEVLATGKATIKKLFDAKYDF